MQPLKVPRQFCGATYLLGDFKFLLVDGAAVYISKPLHLFAHFVRIKYAASADILKHQT